MITIISGTNRLGSNTRKVAINYSEILEELGHKAEFLDLEWMDAVHKDEHFMKIESELLIPSQKFIILVPEYNGAFPGIFKLFLDLTDIKKVWNNKKAMLVGVSDGRAGNARGLDTLTNILNYLKVQVLPNKIPLSQISTELNQEDKFVKPQTIDIVTAQLKQFIEF